MSRFRLLQWPRWYLMLNSTRAVSINCSSLNTLSGRNTSNKLQSNSVLKDEDLADKDERAIGLTPKEQRILRRRRPPADIANSELLKVALIGAPNAGKSTLANRLVGWKFAAVSEKVHTTRHRTIGTLTENNKQVVFLDTPGIIVPKKLKQHNLEKSLLIDPHIAIYDADLIVVVVDVSHVWHRARLDPEILRILHLHHNKQSILVLNKVDLLKDKSELLRVVRILTEGVVGGVRSWSTAGRREKNVVDLRGMINKMKLSSNADNNRPLAIEIHENDRDESTIDKSVSQTQFAVTSATSDDAYYQSDRVSEGNADQLQSHILTDTTGKLTNLADTDSWKAYYTNLKTIGRHLSHRLCGWQGFDRVFMISALSGDGVAELKAHLLKSTLPGVWMYHPSLVTDQNPVELARLCVWERLLDNLPQEIPYNLKIKLSCWETTDDGLLRASFDIICCKKRHLHYVLGKEGSTIRRIAAEVKQELMNTFRQDLSLQLIVKGGAPGVEDPVKVQLHE